MTDYGQYTSTTELGEGGERREGGEEGEGNCALNFESPGILPSLEDPQAYTVKTSITVV